MVQLLPPASLGALMFKSPPWKCAMTRLYRRVLVLHQCVLNEDQRNLGDKFVKMEFRRHAEATEHFAVGFYESWFNYCAQLEAGVTSRHLTSEELALMDEDQKTQLTQMRQEVANFKTAVK
jgi:hypothetical protein